MRRITTRYFAVLFLGAAVAFAADRCDPPPELAGFIRTLPTDNYAKRAAIEQRLKQAPDDFTLNRLIVDSFVYQRSPDRDRYRQLLEAHPGSLDYQYLQARSLVGSNTKEALRIYAQILEKDPDYPWAHLSQLEILRSPAFRDRSKLEASFSVITRVCPALLEPYRYLTSIADNGAASRAAEKLRAMLKDAKNPLDLALFRTLWAVEFRVRPAAEQDQERKQVADDLKQLISFEQDPQIQVVIENGAKLAGDEALAQRMARERKPDPSQFLVQMSNAWLKEHPRPKDDDSPEKRRAYGRDLLAKSEEWRNIAPDNVIGYSERVKALIFLNAPADEVARAGDEFLALIRRKGGLTSSWIVSLATAYMEGGALLDRVPELVSEAIKRLDDPEAVIEIDLAPNRQITAASRQMLVHSHVDALLVLAQTYEKEGDRNKAHALLWQASDYLASKAPSRDETDQQMRNSHAMTQYRILRLMAEMAEREGRKLDALNGYRETLAVRSINREELVSRQRKLWKELGGSDEGWQQWLNPVAEATPTTAVAAAPDRSKSSAANRKLPMLSARDIDGGQWTLDRLAGKTTIATVWATWCEPCRAELPYFAKLVERLKSRNDVLAISFNIDDNIAVAESFAKSQSYKFPVLFAKQYAEDLMPLVSVPRTWIIKNGVIIEEYEGFGADGDKWVEEMLSRLK